jgi:nucleotide-binding universal stress UspA family protein
MLNKTVETVIVGLDFSPYSKIVLKQAKVLAKFFDAKLVLVNAVNEPVVFTDGLYYLPGADLKDSLHELKSFYKAGDPSVKYISELGSPTNVLMNVADRYKNSIIVVGYRGHSRITKFLFVSTPRALTLKAKVPVWIHRGNKVRPPKHLLIAHDLTSKSSKSIRFVKSMEQMKPLRYQVYSVENKPLPVLDMKQFLNIQNKIRDSTTRAVKSLKQQFDNLPILLASGNDTTEKISKQSKKFDALVMTLYHDRKLFTPSETAKVLRQTPVPLLVVH